MRHTTKAWKEGLADEVRNGQDVRLTSTVQLQFIRAPCFFPARYGPEVAEKIRVRKETDPALQEKEIRYHPEIPDDEAGQLLEVKHHTVKPPKKIWVRVFQGMCCVLLHVKITNSIQSTPELIYNLSFCWVAQRSFPLTTSLCRAGLVVLRHQRASGLQRHCLAASLGLFAIDCAGFQAI